MHIAEGIVKGVPAAVSCAAGVGLMAAGVMQMNRFVKTHPQRKPLLGLAGAFIFFLSLLSVPSFTGTCSHPCGSPLAGILLGPWVGCALTGLSLLLQAAFFAHGGFSTWGLNLIALGIGGAVCGWLVFRLALAFRSPLWMAGFLGGLMGDVMTYLISGLILGGCLSMLPEPRYSFTGYLAAIYINYLRIQGPIAIGEALLTGFTLRYIYQQRPEVLESLHIVPARRATTLPTATIFLLLGLLSLAVIAPTKAYASESRSAVHAYTGMDESVNGRLASEAGRPPRKPYLDTESMGDLWNALLLGAGGICGFILGRYWYVLFDKRRGTTGEQA